MTLSPLDIRNKTFSTKMRGFSPEEVDDFLDQIIVDYEESLRSNRELEKALKHAEEKLEYFNELKDALNQSIIVAQDTADKLKEGASKEASFIVTKANEDSDKMISDAKRQSANIVGKATSQAVELANETDDLKKKTRVFRQRLILMLETQLETVKSEDWEDLLKPFSAYLEEEHVNLKEVLADEVIAEDTQANGVDEVEIVAEEVLSSEAEMPVQEEVSVKSETVEVDELPESPSDESALTES